VRTHLGGGDTGAATTAAGAMLETGKSAVQTAASAATSGSAHELSQFVQRKLLS